VIRRVRARRTLTRIHLWLGWIVGVPLLFWTVSGLWMAARPIEEVRGETLKAKPPALVLPQKIVPPVLIRSVKSITLEQRVVGPQWTISYVDGGVGRASPITGQLLPGVNASEARALAQAAVSGANALQSVRLFAANANPLDLRRDRPAWQAHFADGLNVYVDAESGSILAYRTGQWRLYDWMWGLHIMDLGGREATSHATLILFAAIAAIGTLLALVLLPIASWRKKRRWP
jgi:PepSY-associated TM region